MLVGYLMLSNGLVCFSKTSSFAPAVEASISNLKNANHWPNLTTAGDTNIRVRADQEILPEKPVPTRVLTNLQKEAGLLRVVSVGGSLSAGFRDGGLYREGQLTAFSNLVARQMGAAFVQPLFSSSEGNGTGYKTVATIEPLVTYRRVVNNLGISKNGNETTYSKFEGKETLDQAAFPEVSKGLGYYNSQSSLDQSYKYIDRVFTAADRAKYKRPRDWVEAQNANLFIFELGFDDIYRAIVAGGRSISAGPFAGYETTAPEFECMKSLAAKKMKGILLNVPEVFDFPYFKQITDEKISKLNVKIAVQTSYRSESYRPYDAAVDHLIPTPTTEKLLRGELKGNVKLRDEDVISQGTNTNPELKNVSPVAYNTFEIARESRKLGWPVVDLYGLYKAVLAGNYLTHDGVLVNPAWPNGGNFFSADGIYPTAFGQAVIANEVIKTLNKHYGLAIPLVQTKFFLKK